jgi:hypothetical protein
MKRKKVLKNQLNEIMDSFDFDQVHKIMSALNWKWAYADRGGVPDQSEIRKEARRLMKQAIAGDDCATGGFHAWVVDGKDKDGPWTKLNLSFGLDTIHDGESHD